MSIKIKSFEEAVYDKSIKERSAWNRGVAKYALDLIDSLKERGFKEIEPRSPLFLKQCLNGAQDWKQYSEGGCALICDFEIANRLCTRSEITRYYHGNPNGKRPNTMEATWLETQARALFQAFNLLKETATTHARGYDGTKAA